MPLLERIASTLPAVEVERVCIGSHWTAVVVTVEGQRRCGLASTLGDYHPLGGSDLPLVGKLDRLASRELTALTQSNDPALRSIGVAAINAILRPGYGTWVEMNAEDALAIYGAGRRVVLVGQFLSIPRLKMNVGNLVVLELDPRTHELPTGAVEEVLSEAQVVALSGMTLINNNFEDLVARTSSDAIVVLFGPSTPLSPIVFDSGVDLLCGSLVTDIDAVLQAVDQGANFHRVHQAGLRLVTMGRAGIRTPKTAQNLHKEEPHPV